MIIVSGFINRSEGSVNPKCSSILLARIDWGGEVNVKFIADDVLILASEDIG